MSDDSVTALYVRWRSLVETSERLATGRESDGLIEQAIKEAEEVEKAICRSADRCADGIVARLEVALHYAARQGSLDEHPSDWALVQSALELAKSMATARAD